MAPEMTLQMLIRERKGESDKEKDSVKIEAFTGAMWTQAKESRR